MKRYFIYIIMVVAALFVGCTVDTVTEPEMVEIGDIEVTFSVDGEEVRALDLASVSHTIQVDVTLNNEGVYWTPVSNQSWCQIVEAEHRGNGFFTILINANDSFDAREDATISFKAGEFEQDMLTVTHNGNVFVLEQVYGVSTKASGSFTTLIKTRDAGEEWGFECDSWITATKGAVSTDANGFTVTEVTIAWEENASISRYGEIKLKKNDKNYADGWINIWQYGTELEYDEEGNLLLEAQDVAPLELRVPKQTVKDIVMPSWVTYEQYENADSTISYMLQFAGNPSDANHIRTTELEISFLSGAANIKLPVIKQKFYAMEGLVSGPGLKLFAETWNSGGDVSQWYVDGVPTMLGDIDLTEVTEWVSIGTKERPWTGEFNGNGKKILNLKASQPLFGYCENATLKNIVIDETSSFRYIGSYDEELYLAAIAGAVKATTIESSTNNAKVSLEASSKADATCAAHIAGIVAKSDATSVVKMCTNMAIVSVPNSCTTIADEGNFYVGGLVGYNEGTIEDGFNNGAIEGSAQVTTTYLGGVAGYNAISSGILRNNLNAGALDYKASRGSNVSLNAYVGGITGVGNGEISGNTNEGDITSTSNVTNLYMGGIVGAILEPNAKLQNNTNANASDATATGKALYTYVGGLAGYVSDEASLSFDFTSDSGVFAGSIFAGNAEVNKSAIIAAGGFIGYAESALSINGLNYEGTITMDISEVTSGDYYTFGGLVGRAAAPLTITSSTTTGSMPVTATSTVPTTKITIGGIVGLCETDVTVKGCTNNMPIEYAKATPSKSNGVISHLGGIVGRVYSGKTHIEDCHNKGKITNRLYNNNLLHDLGGTTTGKIAVAAGVLGSYGYLIDAESTDSAIVKDCTNITAIEAYRGGVAGVVGYIRNGVIDGCTYLNGRSDSQNNSYAGGIVCIADDTIIRGCKATADLVSKPVGSLYIRCGGIAAWTRGATTVENCQFYGTLKYTASAGKDDFCGGIIALAEDEECVVKDCSYGGSVNGVTISENNCAEHAVGAGSLGNYPVVATISNISYWNGK